ncbi:hypothetical protein QVD17_18068 [Tagetes erecta]|uniref:Tify domain-containing protein n=1 Tax=Tagetes erecta TaxID=13708 RepID=A0AAD8KJY8_TARER|nr:hypothetical protein QVD17_18068 [Tagetes erecta]
MRRNCNLELRLVPPPSPIHLRQQGNSSDNINMVGGDLKEKQNQQLTIFYDGKISVCDVTEHQAKTILKLASEETEDKCVTTPSSTTTSSPSSSSPLMSPPASNQAGTQPSFLRIVDLTKILDDLTMAWQGDGRFSPANHCGIPLLETLSRQYLGFA